METEQICRLMREFSALGLTALELESGGSILKIRKEAPSAPGHSLAEVPAYAAVSPAPVPEASASEVPAREEATDHKGGRVVRAPLVGTVYAAPSPGAPPYVQVGQKVEKGAPLCLIEAMKMMNEVTAPAAGVVRAILFENGQLAAFDQALVEIEES